MADFEFNLRDIFRILKRQKWVIILAPIGVGLMTYWSSVTPPPVYEAESVVKISRVAANTSGHRIGTLMCCLKIKTEAREVERK